MHYVNVCYLLHEKKTDSDSILTIDSEAFTSLKQKFVLAVMQITYTIYVTFIMLYFIEQAKVEYH